MMITNRSSIPRSYQVDPNETYVCKYCGHYVAIAQFHFHRCK